ncbi:hypothetical protein LTR08_009119 [Meristemomyces frigidus]|nr:hypothetical protein LTR08_009119 [Meristemomyces frigidus]
MSVNTARISAVTISLSGLIAPVAPKRACICLPCVKRMANAGDNKLKAEDQLDILRLMEEICASENRHSACKKWKEGMGKYPSRRCFSVACTHIDAFRDYYGKFKRAVVDYKKKLVKDIKAEGGYNLNQSRYKKGQC